MASISKWCRSNQARSLGLCLLAILLVTSLGLANLDQTLENRVLDEYYRLRWSAPPPPDLLIVGIDETSFQELRQAWPWPRRLHAELVRRLAAAQARLIVFDISFADPSTQEDDQLFAAAIRQANNVILAQTLEYTEDPMFSRQILVQPLESLRMAAKGLGLSMVTPDADGVIRHFHLRLGGHDTMPLVTAHQLKSRLPLPTDLSGLIHYVGPPRHIDTVSYYQVLDKDHPLPAARIRDRIVLVGRMSGISIMPQGQTDTFYTPFFGGTGQLMSGVEVQGNIIYTLLKGNWGGGLPPLMHWGLLLTLLLVLGYPLARLPPLAGLWALAIILLLVSAISILLFLLANFWMPPVLLCLGLTLVFGGNVLAHYLVEAQEKRRIRHAFSRYVSPLLVGAILAHPEQLQLGGDEVEVTILFADLAGFTGISERMAPTALIQLLNEYFTPMSQIILNNQGTLDKYIGDAIMALWGAPIPMPNHAQMACQAALEMQAKMLLLQQEWEERGLPPLKSRFGLHSGPVVAGNVGSQDRFNYTVLGDSVNLASRMEGVNKHYGTEILLSESTYSLTSKLFLMRELDKVQVRGRVQPVTIYELLEPRVEAAPEWLEVFAAGRAAYLGRQWGQAANLFRQVLELKAEDKPAKLYLHRCLEYLHHPPPDDWQGVHALGNP